MKLETRNSKLETDELSRRARHIKLLLMDCDGVLTDGRIWLTPEGDEHKAFHVRDGQGIVLLHRAALQTGIISGRISSATERRARELEMAFLRQGVTDKTVALDEIRAAAGVSLNECAYIGDDVGDVALMRRVGLAIAVADAADEAKETAHHVTRFAGGRGAVREVCEMILRARKDTSESSD